MNGFPELNVMLHHCLHLFGAVTNSKEEEMLRHIKEHQKHKAYCDYWKSGALEIKFSDILFRRQQKSALRSWFEELILVNENKDVL